MNRAPCPPWCVTDHGEEIAPGMLPTFHSTDNVKVDVCDYHIAFVSGYAASSDADPEVYVGGLGPALFVALERADSLAGLIEKMAGATPEQHRALAAAIRQAAADITGTEQ